MINLTIILNVKTISLFVWSVCRQHCMLHIRDEDLPWDHTEQWETEELDWRKDYELPLPWPSLSRLSAPRCQARLWRTEGEKMAIREKFCHKTCLRSNHCCGQQQRLKEKLWGWLKLELEMHFIISFFSIIWLSLSSPLRNLQSILITYWVSFRIQLKTKFISVKL